MSSNPEQKGQEEKNGRVMVGDLQQQEKELSDEETRQITGGGGAMGGVDNMRKPGVSHQLATFGEAPAPETTGGRGGIGGEF